MTNQPASSDDNKRRRRPHPLEAPPTRDSIDTEQYRGQRVTLRMPVVPPYAVWVLIAVNSIIYVVANFLLGDAQARSLYEMAWSNHTRVLSDGQYYRLFSAMFLHSDQLILHILFNMYALYIIGVMVERFYGHSRFLIIYFLGGLGGSVLSVLLNPPNVVSVGASGAVFAVFGAQIVFLYRHRKLFGAAAKAHLQQAVLIAVFNFAIGFINALDSGAAVNIDNWGHVGGFAGGMVLAWFISPVFIPKRHPDQADALTIEDINPLESRYQPVLIYISVLLAALLVGSFLAI